MKLSAFLTAFVFILFIACNGRSTDQDHNHTHDNSTPGHSHGDGTDAHIHEHEALPEQEEFTIEGDTTLTKSDSTHVHEDGSVHHNH